jgi:hypothetical protein
VRSKTRIRSPIDKGISRAEALFMDDDLERSIARREARSSGYRARLARELRQQSASAGQPAASKARRVAGPGAPGPDKRVRRKSKTTPSSPVLTELSAKLSSTAQAMRAALDRRTTR